MANIMINAKKLKETIKQSSLSSQELAKVVGISPHDIYNSYKGNGMKFQKLDLIARKLGKPIEFFMDDSINYINNGSTKQSIKVSDKPYNPVLYRQILDLVEKSLDEVGIEITPENIKNLHTRIYNIAVEKEGPSNDFIDGVVRSTIEYYL
ncbi:hypothetical protein N8772_02305 [Rickettsiales bacterium]|nr:hypothetical protein [Rickettsiales bacterium]